MGASQKLHGFAREISVVPNDEPQRGRCKVRAICECGHEESGFGNTRLSAWRRSLSRLRDHLDEFVATLSRPWGHRRDVDVFDIFPGPGAEESLERAFAASRRAYRLASRHLSVDVVRSPEFDEIIAAIPEFGEAGIHLLTFYAAKAQSDVRAGIGPKHRAESAGCTTPDYEPWNDLGLYIPGSFVHVESSEDGSEWLRIGGLAPIQAGIGVGVSEQIGTLLISRERVIRRVTGRQPSGSWHYQAAFIPSNPNAISGPL